MKPDARLRADVLEELAWEPGVKDAEIVVGVKRGAVTLTGYVETYAQKCAAERAVARVSGARAVATDLQVKLPSAFQRTDSDIARAAASTLECDTEVPAGVDVTVDNGWVTLDGVVEWQFERSAAERAVRCLRGVRGLTNRIVVQPKFVSTADVSQSIADALRRSAELDAGRIKVEAADGKVTLKGKVRSWAERRDAETAAWCATGVTHVDDRLEISP